MTPPTAASFSTAKGIGRSKGGWKRKAYANVTHTHSHTHSVRFVSFPQTGQGDAPIKCRLPVSMCLRVCVYACVCSVKRLTAKAIRFPPGAKSNVDKLMHRACLQLNLNKMLSLLSITRQMPAASYYPLPLSPALSSLLVRLSVTSTVAQSCVID